MEIRREIVGEIPKGVSINYDEIKSYLASELEKYRVVNDGSEITLDQYRSMKDGRAKLNALSNAISGELTGLRKMLLAPIDAKDESGKSFKEKIDDLICDINNVKSTLESGISTYENEQNEKKSGEIYDLLVRVLDSEVDDEEFKKSCHFTAWANEQMHRKRSAWLNSTTSMSQIEDEIKEEVARCAKLSEVVRSVLLDEDESVVKIAMSALYQNFSEEEAAKAAAIAKKAKKEENQERTNQITEMAEGVKLSEHIGEEGAKPKLYSCTMRFVGTLEAFENLRQYIDINDGLTYKVVEKMSEV